jgi:hypothetical protein
VFTARYALRPYIKQIRFVFKGLIRSWAVSLVRLFFLWTVTFLCILVQALVICVLRLKERAIPAVLNYVYSMSLRNVKNLRPIERCRIMKCTVCVDLKFLVVILEVLFLRVETYVRLRVVFIPVFFPSSGLNKAAFLDLFVHSLC